MSELERGREREKSIERLEVEQRGHGATEGKGEKWKRTAWKSTFYFWEQEGGRKQGRAEAEGPRCHAPIPSPRAPLSPRAPRKSLRPSKPPPWGGLSARGARRPRRRGLGWPRHQLGGR